MLFRSASFLRQTLEKKTKISLQDELTFVKNYVWIENMRFNQEICLHILNNIETKCYIPKFSIQLLVENAIKHNKKHSKVLNIEINIYKDLSNHLVIDVIDDGDGFENLKLGIGLTNLKERIELLHGGRLVYTRLHNKTIFTIILKDKYENSNY